MPPDVRRFYHERIGNFTAVLLLGIVTLCWGIMVFLSFLGPLEVISCGIGALQDAVLTFWLTSLKVYSGNRNLVRKLLLSFIPMMILVIPWLNDMPAEIVGMLGLILTVRFEDIQMAVNKAASAKKTLHSRTQQEIVRQRSYAAEVRAVSQREDAKKASIEELASA